MSIGISPECDQGGQWLAHITQLIKEGSVTDVTLVPVGISYDCVPKTSIQVALQTHTFKLTQLRDNCDVLVYK